MSLERVVRDHVALVGLRDLVQGGLHRHRQVVSFIGDKDMTHKLFEEIAPRYAERNGGYTRILKLGPRHGDNAPMARIELV